MSTNIESLELEIVSNSKSAIDGIEALTQSLGKLKSATKSGMGLSSVSKELGTVASSTHKASASFTDLYHKLGTLAKGFKTLGKGIISVIEKSADYTENMNLFSVAMGKYGDDAKAYADKVSNVLGIDTSEWVRAQGVFMTLATGFGVAGDRAAVMSQNLTQLGYDLASFYNLKTDDAMKKLKSGLSGELEPLRNLGYDLSQAKLEATALKLGIDKTVSSMTQAEKAELRYYAIMTQVTVAQGDMARTLDDPANQIRVLKAQFEMAARSIGNIFIPALNAILPIAIAVVQVVRNLADIIAGLFGYEFPEVDYSGVSEMSNAATGTSEAMDDAKDSAKKLKSYMLGFDELNVLNPGDDGGGASAADALGSGFDFELPDYTEKFLEGATNSKVSQIVADMKEWLGITEEIDSWSELFDTRLGKILIAVGAVGTAFGAWKLAKGFTSAFSAISSLFGKKGIGGSSGGGSFSGSKKALDGIGSIAIIVGGVVSLVAVLGLLTKIPGFNDTIKDGLDSLATVFKGLLPVFVPLALVSAGIVLLGKVKVSDVAKGAANAAIIIAGVEGIIVATGAFMSIPYLSDFLATGIKTVQDAFNGLYEVALPIAVLSAYIVALGWASPATVTAGFAGFAVIIGGTEVLLTAIGALMTIPGFSDFLATGIKSVQDMVNGLYEVAVPIGVLSAYLVVLGWASPTAILLGLEGFALVIGGFTAVLVALGALKQIDGFDWLIAEGGEVLVSLGNTLGKFVGSIVGGFGEGISDSFPKIGENLAGFMDNAKPFFEGLDGIDSNAVGAVTNLGSMVLALTAADVLNGLTSWLTGGNSLIKFGEDLKAFAPNLVEYANTVKDIDGESIKASSNAAKTLAEFAKNIPNDGGVVGWFMGENSIDVFGEKLPSFGENIMKYAGSVEGLDADVVENSARAAKAIIEIAKEVPNEGGIVGWFTGENNIDTFGNKLPSFGTNLKKYSDSVKGIDASVVENSTRAAKSVIAIAKEIPNEGGVAAWFAGENNIDVFGAKLPSFGKNIKSYADSVKGLDANVVNNSAKAANSIIEIARGIPNEGGMVSWFTGDNGIDKFGQKIASFGASFKVYYDYVKDMLAAKLNCTTACLNDILDFALRVKDSGKFDKLNSFTDAIIDLGKAIKDLPSSKTITITVNQVNNSSEVSSIWDALGTLPLFASGGFPEQGQMFIAREAGAEMVGSIGRRTAVANNDQIVSGIAGGVAEANEEQNALLREQNSLLRAILDKDGGVYLDGKNLTNSVEKYQRERGRVLITGGVM